MMMMSTCVCGDRADSKQQYQRASAFILQHVAAELTVVNVLYLYQLARMVTS